MTQWKKQFEHLFIRRSSQNNCHCVLYQLCKILDYFKFWFRMTIRNEKRLPVTNIATARCPTNANVIMLVWKVSNFCSYCTCSCWKSKILNSVGRGCVVLQAAWPSRIRGMRKLVIFIFVFKKSLLYSPKLAKCYFLQIHTKICSKMPIFYFNRPKRPLDNC